jgi:hypothetical protein
MERLDPKKERANRIYMVASDEWLEIIHKWRRKQPEPPSLSAAIRELVEIGAKAERSKQRE